VLPQFQRMGIGKALITWIVTPQGNEGSRVLPRGASGMLPAEPTAQTFMLQFG